MNNKTLGIIIGILLVAFFGIAFAVRHKNAEVANTSSTTNPEYTAAVPTATPIESPTPSLIATTTPTPMPSTQANGCTRNFDANKLQTAKVSVVNRVVQLDIKNFGKLQLSLYNKDAPKAVENFLRLVNSGYYDCLTVHRVAQGFVIQAGDPNGNGTGGQSAFGSAFADELDANTPSYKAGYLKGVLAMANSGPNTNGSQFFIMLADQPQMPHLYTIFGKVTSGQSLVDKIGQVPIIPSSSSNPTDGRPVTTVVITKAIIIK